MNHHQKIIALLCFVIAMSPLKSQSQRMLPRNTELTQIAERSPNTSWIYFKESSALQVDKIFTTHAIAFGLGPSDEMRLMSTHDDELTGLTRQKFKQYHTGIPVHGGSVMLFSKNGIAIKAKGSVIQNLPRPISNTIGEEAAIENAIHQMPGTDYLWLDERRVERYRQRKNDPTATLRPKAELIYLNNTEKNSSHAEDFTLCWKVDVGMQRSGSYSIILNAVSGDFIRKIPLFHSCNGTSVTTPMNGTQTIYTSKQGRCTNANYYELWDDCSVDIKVENDDFGSGDDDPICSANNTWNTTSGLTGDGVQVLWSMRKSYDWFLSNFGWNSYNDGGASIDCTVLAEFGEFSGDNGENAQYEIYEEDFDFGYGVASTDPSDSYTALDIVAHEYTHGVNDYTADLDLGGESGALNESFSDIFGEAVEQMTVNLPENEKWFNGQAKSDGHVRNMKNPNDDQHPKTYLTDQYWDNVNEEVHVNAGVQNYFFYLLCEGGSGTNANNDHYSVSGIGLNAGITIAWYALNYLDDNEYYTDSRDAWLEAAKDIYGNCSSEMIQVGNAWYAVGVGNGAYNTQMIASDEFALLGDITREAIEYIFTVGDVDINTTSPWDVTFYSGNEILLTVGFTVESGNEFVADVHSCSVTLHSDPEKLAFGSNTPGDGEIIESAEQQKLQAYPNPSSGFFNLECELASDKTVTVSVLDFLGREIMNSSVGNPSPAFVFQLDLTPFANGKYRVLLKQDTQILSTSIIKIQ